MDIVRKNWLSIACGVIALIAVAAIPTYISSQQQALQTKLKARAATYQSLRGLQTKQRHLPVVSLDPNASPADLSQFPGPKVIEAGAKAVKQVQHQSVQFKKLADDMNLHKLLVPGSLPNPANPYEFQQAYVRQFEVNGPLAQELDSIAPPTDQEIRAENERRTKSMTGSAPHDQKTGKIYDENSLEQQISHMQATLADEMRLDAATNHKMYMASTALDVVPELSATSGVTKAADPDSIWYAQMGYWVQKDVISAIAALNAKSRNVAQSTVKQLLQIQIPQGPDMYVLPGAPTGAAAAAPGAGPASTVAANTETDPLPSDFSVSPTGRVCNGVFDVVHFTVTLNVQAADVNRVIQAMEKDRLITVFTTDIQAVNSVEQEQDGYFFGPNPVATLTLQCEELFMRDWTRPYMPPNVKALLNVQEPQQTTALAQ